MLLNEIPVIYRIPSENPEIPMIYRISSENTEIPVIYRKPQKTPKSPILSFHIIVIKVLVEKLFSRKEFKNTITKYLMFYEIFICVVDIGNGLKQKL